MTTKHIPIPMDGASFQRTLALQHRAITRIACPPSLLLQLVYLPILFCGLILWVKPYLFSFWAQCIAFWSGFLGLSLGFPSNGAAPVETDPLGLIWSGGAMAMYSPTALELVISALLVIAALAASALMVGALAPLKYVIRILATVVAVSIAYFMFWPTQFPYSIASHIRDIASLGYVLLLVVPVMLTFGYYVFPFSLVLKIKNTLLILAYFVIFIPLQIVLHVLILQNFSLLFAPVLYICFGTLFDVLIFIALYSWAASTIPEEATIPAT